MLTLIWNELYKAFRLKKIYLFMFIIMIIEISTVMQYKLRGSEYIFITPNGQSLPLTLLAGLNCLMQKLFRCWFLLPQCLFSQSYHPIL